MNVKTHEARKIATDEFKEYVYSSWSTSFHSSVRVVQMSTSVASGHRGRGYRSLISTSVQSYFVVHSHSEEKATTSTVKNSKLLTCA